MSRVSTYTCLDCGCEFNTPVSYQETHGLDSPPYEDWSCCPVCGGPYAPTHVCDICEKIIPGWYIRLRDGTEACEACFTTHELGDEADWLI